MALTKVSRGLLSTSIVDNGNATAITIDSSENVGIGVSAPTSPLHIKSATDVNVRFDDSGSSSHTWYMNDAQNLYIPNAQLASTHTFYANGQRKVDIDSSGNVGINETAPFGKLHISDTQTGRTVADSVGNLLVLEDDENGMSILSSNAGAGYILFGDAASAASGGIVYDHSANKFNFRTNDAWNRMILDASGNLLVGKTTTAIGTQGIRLEGNNGKIEATRSGNVVTAFNRTGSDGTISEWMKDGTTVGSIGAAAGNLYIVSNDVGLNFAGGNDGIYPATANGAQRDAAIDLGHSSHRFKDLWLSGASYIPDVRSTGTQYFTHTTDVRFRTVTGTERMRIDSLGKLLVGRTSATFGSDTGLVLRPNNDSYIIANDSPSLTMRRNNSDGAIAQFYRDGAAVGSIFSGHGGTQVGIGTNTTGITFNPNTRSMMPADPSSTSPQLDATLDIGFSSVRWRDLYLSNKAYIGSGSLFDTGGDISLNQGSRGIRINDAASALSPTNGGAANSDATTDLGVSNIRFRDLYLSGGVYLGGTGGANKMDDYEAGTWTPTLAGHYGNQGTTFNQGSRSGWYTKVGRLVTCQIQISSAGVATANNTDIITISGFPFANTGNVATGASAHTSVAASQGGCWTFITGNTVAFLGNAGSANSSWTWQTGASWAAAHCAVRLTITYTTT